MAITRNQINIFAKNLLRVLDEEGIVLTKDFGSKAGDTCKVDDVVGYVEILSRPSNLRTEALTLSYAVEGVGAPIEARVNEALGYSKIILKSGERVRGYKAYPMLAVDDFGNVIQELCFLPRQPYFRIGQTFF